METVVNARAMEEILTDFRPGKTPEACERIGCVAIRPSYSPPALEGADATCGPFVFCGRT